jgi:hypothetical protein
MCDLYMIDIIYKVKLILSLPLQINFIDSDIKQIVTNLIKINMFMLQSVEVSSPKTINIPQYLNLY